MGVLKFWLPDSLDPLDLTHISVYYSRHSGQ